MSNKKATINFSTEQIESIATKNGLIEIGMDVKAFYGYPSEPTYGVVVSIGCGVYGAEDRTISIQVGKLQQTHFREYIFPVEAGD